MSPFTTVALREQIAAVAARLIAEDGVDYGSAKQRALREVTGEDRGPRDCLPDNALVEDAVREHQALFMADTQPARLLHLRRVALDVMRFLADSGPDWAPYVTGAIVNGTAGEHSDVHLVVHGDNAKDLEIFLVNAGIEYDVAEVAGGEMLAFEWPQRRIASPLHRGATAPESVQLTIVDPRVQRGTPIARADLAALERLIDASFSTDRDR